MLNMNQQQIWQAVLGELELSLSRPNFITWFKQTFISSLEGQKVVIGVPNTFTQSWLKKKYHNIIENLLKKLLESEVLEIHYEIAATPKTNPFFSENKENNKQKEENSTQPQLANNPSATDIPIKRQEISTEQQQDRQKVAITTQMYTNINPKYTFNAFVVGKHNELAFAACQAIAKNPGTVYNPLFIYGGVGLGKTHLMQSVGNEILIDNPKANILYTTSETFTNEYVRAVQQGNAHDFHEKYRKVNVLLIDDIQFIVGKEGTQEAFFHTFNELHNKNKQIILTSDRAPADISIEDRLKSRFAWGMIADISKPDLETRMAILEKKCREKNFDLEISLIEKIASQITHNIREMEGFLIKLIAYHQLKNLKPTTESVEEILRSLISVTEERVLNSKELIKLVAEFYGINLNDMLGHCREKRLVLPRQTAMYLLRSELNSSFPTIGQELGGRDHTTVIYACEKIESAVKTNPRLQKEVEALRHRINNFQKTS